MHVCVWGYVGGLACVCVCETATWVGLHVSVCVRLLRGWSCMCLCERLLRGWCMWYMYVSVGLTTYPVPSAAAPQAAAGSTCVVNSPESYPLGIQYAGQPPHTNKQCSLSLRFFCRRLGRCCSPPKSALTRGIPTDLYYYPDTVLPIWVLYS